MFLINTSSYSGNMAATFQAIESLGGNAELIFKKAGIVFDVQESKHKQFDLKIKNLLCQHIIDDLKVETFGLTLANFIQPTSYGSVGLSLIFSENLNDFIKRLLHFYPFITNTEHIQFKLDGERAYLEIKGLLKDNSAEVQRLQADAWAAIFVKFIRYLISPNYNPLKLHLTGSVKDNNQERYQQYFGCPIQFNSPTNRIYFRGSDLHNTNINANDDIARYHDTLATKQLSRLNIHDFPAMVYSKILELLKQGECSRQNLAHALNMSERTLHNKLVQQGIQYQAYLDKIRFELAQNYLTEHKISISELSYLLGFKHESNFSRAFKRWYGLTPNQYRKKLE